MNTEDKLKAICNYSHKDMATPSAQMISYLDFETYDTKKKKQATHKRATGHRGGE